MREQILAGQTVLIVEDEPLLAMDLADSFRSAGADVLPANTMRAAMAFAESSSISAATIEYQVGGETCASLCPQLTNRDVPFLFYSGYDREMFHIWPSRPFISKPERAEHIIAALAMVIAK